MYKNKYLKYKNKYLELKTKLQFGGGSLHSSDDLVNRLIETVKSNIRDNIRTEHQSMVELSKSNIAKLNIEKLNIENKLGEGQNGIVYDLSPSYVIKKVAIQQRKQFGDFALEDKSKKILEEKKTY